MKMIVLVPDGEPRNPRDEPWGKLYDEDGCGAGEYLMCGSAQLLYNTRKYPIYTRHKVYADDGEHAVLCTIVREWDKAEWELRDIREGEYADRCKERDEAEARVKALETHVSELTAANMAAVASRNSMQEALERLASKRDSWEEAIKKLEAELAVLKQGKSAPGGFEELAAWIECAWLRWWENGNYSAAQLECDLARKIAEIRASLVSPAESEVRRLSTEVADLRRKLAAADARIAEFEPDAIDMHSLRANIRSDYSELNESREPFNQALMRLLSKYRDESDELAALKQEKPAPEPAKPPTEAEIIANNVAYVARFERLAIFKAEIAGMNATNAARQMRGEPPAYTASDFQSAIAKFKREGKGDAKG